MSEKIKLHYLIGDVHKGGHDLHRVGKAVKKMLNAAGAFEVLMVCDDTDIGDMTFDAYFEADLFGDVIFSR